MFASNKITYNNNTECVKFGILSLEVGKTEITRKPQEINIMLDESGSMNDCGEEDEICKELKSKMDLTKHVIKNILEFVLNECKDANIKIGVHSFNNYVRQIFEQTKITQENVKMLIKMVQNICATDGTNIEKALLTLQSITSGCEFCEKTNIIMSDGDANVGIRKPKELAKLVDSSATNYFVGFGLQHNPKMFEALSACENSSYYFVDKMEKSGFIYGEIMYNILYNKYNSVKLEIMNPNGQTFLYDYVNNDWKTQIYIGKMSGEMKKLVHIKTNAMEMVQIKATGYDAETDEKVEQIIMWDGNVADLAKYIYRQRTLELIHRAKIVDRRRLPNKPYEDDEEDVEKMRDELKSFMAEMKDFMMSHDCLEDKLMMSLCDDIVVIYRTIGTDYGLMYSCSRQHSQGAQRLNANCDTPVRLTNHCNVAIDSRNCYSTIYSFTPKDEIEMMMDNHTMGQMEHTETQSRLLNVLSKTDDDEGNEGAIIGQP